MKNVNDKIIETILNLKNLMENASNQEEADAAKRALERKLSRYNLKLEDIVNKVEERRIYCFKYSSKEEKQILIQCVANLWGSENEIFQKSYRYKNGKMEMYFPLTKFEFICLKEFFDFHKNEFKRQFELMKEKLLLAYIENQSIYDISPKEGKSKRSKLSMKDIMDIAKMASVMKPSKFRKTIENK